MHGLGEFWNPFSLTAAAISLSRFFPFPHISRQPTLITVHPSVLAQILDHHTRRPSNPPSSRVIGTLLGVRTNASGGGGGGEEIEIRSCFGVPHSEDDQHIAVDMDYHKGMMELMGKLMGGRKEGGQQGEVIVGW
jgi:translation initiation factor 3 subunit F